MSEVKGDSVWLPGIGFISEEDFRAQGKKGDSVWLPEVTVSVDAGICKAAIDAFGEDYMLNVAMEEPAELIQAISKLRRSPYTPSIKYAREHLVEEIADTYIVLSELARMYNIDIADINSVICGKQDRTLRQIEESKAAGMIGEKGEQR